MYFKPDSMEVFPIAPTPFLPDGAIDYESVASLADFYAEMGVTGIIVLGHLGEPTKLDAEESAKLVKAFGARKGAMPMIVGVSSTGFASMRSLAHTAMEAGAAAVMVAPPPTLRTDDQIYNYFSSVAEALGPDVPWILQDYPLILEVVFTPALIRRIITDHETCVVFKHEDWPGLEKLRTLRGFIRDGSLRKLPIFMGNGGLFLDFEMDNGADGSMTGYGFPEMLLAVTKLGMQGKRDEAHDLFAAHLPYLRYENQLGLGLAVRKHILKLRGAIAHETMRKPFIPLSEAGKGEVRYLLERLHAKHPIATRNPLAG